MSKTTVASSGIDLSDSFAFTGTVTGAGRYNLLTTTTVTTDVSDVTFSNSFITSTYKIYVCEFYNVKPASDDQQFFMRVSTDNFSSNSQADMINRGMRDTGDDSSSASSAFGDVYQTSSEGIRLTGKGADSGGDTGRSVNGHCILYNAADSGLDTSWQWDIQLYANDGYQGFFKGAGQMESAATHNAWRFLFNSGNIDTGTFKLYGVTT